VRDRGVHVHSPDPIIADVASSVTRYTRGLAFDDFSRTAVTRSVLLSSAFGFLSCAAILPLAHAAPERYVLDPEHTTIAFLIEHLGFAGTLGRFGESSGAFTWDPDARELTDVRIVVATESVDTDHEGRDEHVRGKDFLQVSRYPEMIFESAGPIALESDAVRVDGELSLRGEKRPLSLDVTLNKAGRYPFGHRSETVGLSARGTLLRSEYGMEYAIGNGFVGDEVALIIEVEALRE